MYQGPIEYSARLFIKSSELGFSNPSPAGECAPPPFGTGGRAHSLAREGSGRVPIPKRGNTLWYSIYMYFVQCQIFLSFRPPLLPWHYGGGHWLDVNLFQSKWRLSYHKEKQIPPQNTAKNIWKSKFFLLNWLCSGAMYATDLMLAWETNNKGEKVRLRQRPLLFPVFKHMAFFISYTPLSALKRKTPYVYRMA